jgi:adenosylcobinamide-GDP ribazoletransferase
MLPKLTLRLKLECGYFLSALLFFTRLPIRCNDYAESNLHKATRFLPLVGILVGGIGALVFWLADILLPQEIAIILSMAATILLTGAFHEDGLADAMDGLGGGWSREQVLTIMADSRLGSYGAIGLVMVLLGKYQTLSYQLAALMPVTIIAGHALSRLCSVLVMFTQRYAKLEGKSKPLATQLNVTELIMATFFGLLPLAFFPMHFLLALVPVAIVWLGFSLNIKRRIGGYTGDCLGAMQQLTELAFYMGLLASAALFF